MDLVAFDEDLANAKSEDREEFSSDGEDGGLRSPDAADEDGVVVILTQKPEKKKRKVVPAEEKNAARSVHQCFLLACLAIAQRVNRAADLEETYARALSFEAKKKLASTLAAIFRATKDVAVCVAYVRRCAELPCRLVAALPKGNWKGGITLEERVADLTQTMRFWVEYWQRDEWHGVCVDPEAEPRFDNDADDPISYVVGLGNGEVVDVSQRYSSESWGKTYRHRNTAIEEWWDETLAALSVSPAQARPWTAIEARLRREAVLAEPIPQSLSAIKSHPTFVLAEHVSRYFALLPEAEPVGTFKDGKDVFWHGDVVAIHSRDKWVEKGKVLLDGIEPLKRLPSRSKKDAETLLYGPWQVKDMDVGEAVDGIVPKNDHGNVYLYRDDMMPRGCVLLDVPGLSMTLTKKLGIDAAKAVVKFTFKRGHAYPEYAPGLVVAQSNVAVLREACAEQDVVTAKRATERTEKRILSNWRKLVRRTLVYSKLKDQYADQ